MKEIIGYGADRYYPEGCGGESCFRNPGADLFDSSEVIAFLERAAAKGLILEAPALRCSSDCSLIVDLCGVKGIVPREECILTAPGEDIRDIAIITRVGKPICFKVKRIVRDTSDRSCGFSAILSRRDAQLECREKYIDSLVPGDIVNARITHLEHFGAFVDIGCGIVSMLPIDCISVSRISHPRDRFSVGMRIKCVISSIDKPGGRVCVSHKELLGSWLENAARFEAGQTVAGIIRSVEDYGVFIELTPNLAGLSEYRDGCLPGMRAAVYIKSILPERMKIKLSLIDVCPDSAQPEAPEYMLEGAHIDRFRYSPPECPRIIETDFTKAEM